MSEQTKCQNCGACKECGAGGRPAYVPYPVYPLYPWSQQPWGTARPYPYWYGQSTGGIVSQSIGAQTASVQSQITGNASGGTAY